MKVFFQRLSIALLVILLSLFEFTSFAYALSDVHIQRTRRILFGKTIFAQ